MLPLTICNEGIALDIVPSGQKGRRSFSPYDNDESSVGEITISSSLAEESFSLDSHSQREMAETIEALRNYGVNNALISVHWSPSEATALWNGFERSALIFFVTGHLPDEAYNITPVDPLPAEQCLSPTEALHEISEFSSDSLTALQQLYTHGLRGAHLRSWRSTNRWFNPGCRKALVALVKQQDVDVTEALEKIAGLSDNEAWNIYLSIESGEYEADVVSESLSLGLL